MNIIKNLSAVLLATLISCAMLRPEIHETNNAVTLNQMEKKKVTSSIKTKIVNKDNIKASIIILAIGIFVFYFKYKKVRKCSS